MTNLEMLWNAEKGLDLKDMRRLEDYFLGALSVSVEPAIWEKMLDAAVNHLRYINAQIREEVSNVQTH